MEVQEQESLGRWDGLGSRDAILRTEAMENICQVVMRKVEAIKPLPSGALSPPASGSPPNSDLNDILAHLLMLSKQCPFEDVRERSSRLLQAVQVRDSNSLYWGPPPTPSPPTHELLILCCIKLHQAVPCPPIQALIALFCCHLLLSSPPHKHCKHCCWFRRPSACFVKWITVSDTMRHHELINTWTPQEPRPVQMFNQIHAPVRAS